MADDPGAWTSVSSTAPSISSSIAADGRRVQQREHAEDNINNSGTKNNLPPSFHTAASHEWPSTAATSSPLQPASADNFTLNKEPITQSPLSSSRQQSQSQQQTTPAAFNISFTKQKLLLQRQQFLTVDQPQSSFDRSLISSPSAALSSSSQATNHHAHAISSTSSSSSPSLRYSMNAQEMKRSIRQWSRRADKEMQAWWAMGMDPMRQSILRLSNRPSTQP